MSEIIRHPYSNEAYNQLSAVMFEVQRDTTYTTDKKQFGQDEYWEYPHGKGDCEDYVLEMMRRLRALGWARESLDLGVCMVGGEGHAVLLAHTTAGDLVCDDGLRQPTDWRELPQYKWIETSVAGKFGPNDWFQIEATS